MKTKKTPKVYYIAKSRSAHMGLSNTEILPGIYTNKKDAEKERKKLNDNREPCTIYTLGFKWKSEL